jgi:benzoyl-CoA reductase/2-hydroxyglutaryl-CoA dehydratase subunit BcrC/BadD/HgdB
MSLKTTGKDIQVCIGKGTPIASDMIHGGIALDATGKRVLTKNKDGMIIVVGEANRVLSPTIRMGSDATNNFDGVQYNEGKNTFTWTSDQSKTDSKPTLKYGKSFRVEWRGKKLEFACDKIVKISSNYTSRVFQTVLVNTSRNSISVKLPTGPSTTDRVRIVDLYRNASKNLINIDRNGSTIHKKAENDSIECDGGSVTYEYMDSTWVVVS